MFPKDVVKELKYVRLYDYKVLLDVLREAHAMTACHNLVCEQDCECLNCEFWNRENVKMYLKKK